MPRIGQDPGKKQGAPKPRRRKAAPSRPLVLAPGAKWDPKTKRATAPKPKRSPVFQRGLPKPGATIERKTRQATQRSGKAVAGTPGVRRELKPVRRPSSQRERADLIRSTRQAVARLGLTEGQKDALAQTNTPAGLRLRQAQRAQQGGYVRATRETATQGLLRSSGAKPLKPKELKHVRFDKLDPKVKREINKVAREIRGTGNRWVAKPGRDRDVTKLGPASIDLTSVRRATTALGERATSGHGRAAADAGGQVLRRTVKDAADFPQQAVKGLYEVGAAGVEAAQGRTERGKKLAGALTHGFLGEAILHGNPKGALKYASEHPLYAALDLLGAYGAAGRTAGAVARSGALGRRVRRAASTARHDLTIVPGTKLTRKRSYSKNLITQGFQKRGERRARARGENPNVVKVRRSNRAVNRQINSEADAFTAYAENSRLYGREQEARAADRHAVPTRRGDAQGGRFDRMVAATDRALGRPQVTVRGKVRTKRAEQFLISFLVENRVNPADVKGSLRSIEKRLEAVAKRESDNMSPGTRLTNREQRAAIRAVLDSPKALANVERAIAAAKYVSHRSRKLEAKLIKQRALTRQQTRHARERPFAVEQMGARWNPDHMPYEEAVTRHGALKQAEGRARAGERAARKEHRAARLDLARVMGAAARSRGEGKSALILKAAEQPRRYYRGVRDSGERMSTAGGWWDRHKFVSHDREIARSYTGKGGSVERYALAPGAKVLVRDTPEYQRFLDEHGLHRDQTTKTAQLAEKAGYDVVDFRAGDLGAIVLNEKALRRTGPSTGSPRGRSVTRFIDEAMAAAARDPKRMGQLARSEAKDARRLAESRARVARARKARTDARKARVQATKARRQATPKKYVQGLEIGGRRVTLPEITAARTAKGLPEPGFLTHRRDTGGARSYFINWFDTRRTPDAQKRTGEATRLGANDVHPQAVKDSLVRQRGLVDAIRTFDEYIGHFAMKHPPTPDHPNGRRFTWDEAQKYADNMSEESGIPMVPVRMGPGRYGDDVLNMLDSMQGTRAGERLGRRGLPTEEQSLADAASAALDRMMEAPDAAGRSAPNVVLMPEAALERFRKHQLVGTSDAAQAMQKLTSVFRGTVLSLSTKWLFGNVAEAVLRSLLNGVTPRDVFIGRSLMKELRALDAEAADRMFVHTQQGLLFGGSRSLNVYRDRRALDGTIMEVPAATVGAIARMPVIRHALAGIDGYQRLVFGVNKAMERAFQQGVIGKQARHEIQELTDSWGKSVRASKPALRDVARGLTGTPAQIRYARSIDEVLGKYTRFSPTTRRTTQIVAPFLPWYLNSLRFVYWTLPRHHPVKTALLANVIAAMNEDFKKSTEDAPRGDLRSALRTKDGGYVTLARYTPFGAFTSGVEGILDPFYPQLSSIAKIALGQNFTGRKLELSSGEKESTDGQRIAIALNAFLESIVPGLAIARRVREQGRTGFDDSTVFRPKTKPGSAHSSPLDLPGVGKAGNRILNPLRPIYLRTPSAASSGPARKLTPEERATQRELESYGSSTLQSTQAEREALSRELEAYRRMAK